VISPRYSLDTTGAPASAHDALVRSFADGPRKGLEARPAALRRPGVGQGAGHGDDPPA